MISRITFNTVSGGQQTLVVQDYQAEIVLEFFGQAAQAVSGKLHPRVRGKRATFRLDYEACLEPGAYRTLFNNITADLTGGQDEITISEGSDLSNAVVVVPDERTRYLIQATSHIGVFAPSLSFIAVTQGADSDTRYVESGYVTDGYVE